MYNLNEFIQVSALAAVLMLISVSLHYEALNVFSALLDKIKSAGRARIAILICGLISIHITEIWVFAGGFIAATKFGLGYVQGVLNNSLLDYVYYSSMTFTTVGYGDLNPVGPLRFIAAIESLLGLMLITWSASFTYLEMKKFWDKK